MIATLRRPATPDDLRPLPFSAPKPAVRGGGPSAARRLANPFDGPAEHSESVGLTRGALQHLIEQNLDGLVVVGAGGRVLLHNRIAAALLAIHSDDLTRREFTLHHQARGDDNLEVRDADGRPMTIEVRSTTAEWFGRPVHFVALREVRAAESVEAVDQTLFHDPLTGLPTRELFLNRVHDRVRTGGRVTDDPMAVARVDLDRFARINEFYGRQVGDRVLQSIANRLTTAVRPGDYVARLGDDDFAIFFPPGDRSAQHAVAIRVIEALQQPFDLDGRSILCSPTVGFAAHEEGQDEADLVAAAEEALVTDRFQGTGSGGVAHILPTDERRPGAHRNASRDLPDHELSVLYAPLFGLDDSRIVGLQAKARWDHPDDGRIDPGESARVIEESGRIRTLGEWMVSEVIEQIVDWRERRPDAVIPPVTIAVAARHLLDAEFRRVTLLALARADLTPSTLRFAVSETALTDRRARLEQVLTELGSDGFALDLDHYGTGAASITNLQDLPVSGIRLDRIVVERMVEDAPTHRFVEAAVLVAHTFGLRVTADGVETPEQKALLYRMGCDRAQGKHLGRALNAIEASRFFVAAETTGVRSRAQGLLRRGGIL